MAAHTGIKIAAEMVRDPERTKKWLTAALIALLILLALPIIALLGIRALLDEGEITESFDITETELYEAVYPVYQNYMDKQVEYMSRLAEEIVEENTITEYYEETSTDPDTGDAITETKSREVCTVDVYVICNHMNFAYLLSYFSVHNEQILRGEKYTLNEKELTDFLDSIQEVKIQHLGSNYFIYNQFYTIDQIQLIGYCFQLKLQIH